MCLSSAKYRQMSQLWIRNIFCYSTQTTYYEIVNCLIADYTYLMGNIWLHLQTISCQYLYLSHKFARNKISFPNYLIHSTHDASFMLCLRCVYRPCYCALLHFKICKDQMPNTWLPHKVDPKIIPTCLQKKFIVNIFFCLQINSKL